MQKEGSIMTGQTGTQASQDDDYEPGRRLRISRPARQPGA